MTQEIKMKLDELADAIKKAICGDYDTYDISVARATSFLEGLKFADIDVYNNAKVYFYSTAMLWGE